MPSLTADQAGLAFVALLVFAQFYFSWRRNQRDEAREHEPKASPPLHATYATKAEHSELKGRVDKISDDIMRGFERVDQKRSTSIAGLHDDLKRETTALRLEMKTDIKGVHERVNDVFRVVDKIEGRLAGK